MNILKTEAPQLKQTSQSENVITNSLKKFLKTIIQQPILHAQWLNTLSFLEYIGARKILKSQKSEHLNWFLLQHIREETGHALFFKTLSRKISKKYCPSFETPYLMEGKKAENYFQSIDHHAEKNLTHHPQAHYLNYLYTTWMIEERAIKVYQTYNDLLKKNKFSFTLNAVLREEDHHLQTITQEIKKRDLDFKNRIQQLFEYETQQFQELLTNWLKLV